MPSTGEEIPAGNRRPNKSMLLPDAMSSSDLQYAAINADIQHAAALCDFRHCQMAHGTTLMLAHTDPDHAATTGCMVCIPVFDAHRDPLLFADPLEFDPQRFDTNGRDERSNGLFLGFGAGVHPCTGRKFAVLETSLLVSEALKSFEWELVDDDTSAPAMLYAAVRCLGLTLVGDAAARRLEDPFTQASINVPRHPRLNPAQPNSIFRPLDPVRIRYKRK